MKGWGLEWPGLASWIDGLLDWLAEAMEDFFDKVIEGPLGSIRGLEVLFFCSFPATEND